MLLKEKMKPRLVYKFFQSFGNILIGILKCADTVAVLIQGRVITSAYVSIPYPVHKSSIK